MGDRVLLDASNLSIPGVCKLRYRFVGPFLVTARIGEVAYRLDLKGRFTTCSPCFSCELASQVCSRR